MEYIYIYIYRLISQLSYMIIIYCGSSFEAPRSGASNEYPQNMFSLRNEKNVNFWASKSWLDKWILDIYLSLDK